MDKFVIRGGRRISGDVRISGSKNAALPMLAASLLTSEECVFTNVPCIDDTRLMSELLRRLGCEVEFDEPRHRISVRARELDCVTAPEELVGQMRASFLVTGPLLARCGEARSPEPGGCAIGARPKNVDIKGFLSMGAELAIDSGYYVFRSQGMHGERLYLDYPSHTGTENLIMAACLAPGRTVIKNACAEPEVVALAHCLNRMGARISGAGTSEIEILGVETMRGVTERVIPDRLEAGTFAIAAAATKGEVMLYDVNVSHMDPLTYKLGEAGVQVEEGEGTYLVRGNGHLSAVEVQTLHYPGFPTDLQAPFAVLLTQADGVSLIHERVFNDRLQYVNELAKLGANIEVTGQTARIVGPTPLHGAPVRALDIRSGAAMILAGLVADGETEVQQMHHLHRGYEMLEDKLRQLGADITVA